MAIDAVIERIRHTEDGLRLELTPRVGTDGQDTCPGRPALTIRGTRRFEPKVGDEIWGSATGATLCPGSGREQDYARRGVYLREQRYCQCSPCGRAMVWAHVHNLVTGVFREVWRCDLCGAEAELE